MMRRSVDIRDYTPEAQRTTRDVRGKGQALGSRTINGGCRLRDGQTFSLCRDTADQLAIDCHAAQRYDRAGKSDSRDKQGASPPDGRASEDRAGCQSK